MLNCDNRRILIIVVAHIVFALLYFTTSSSFFDGSSTPSSSSPEPQQQTKLQYSRDDGSSQQRQQQQVQSSSSPSTSSLAASRSSKNSKLPTTSGGIFWPELGNRGWRRPTRTTGESHWTCPAVRDSIEKIYATTTKHVNLNGGRPQFSMPWFFHDPYPVCGSILLRHLHGTMDTAHVLRVGRVAGVTVENNKKKTRQKTKAVASSSSVVNDELLMHPTFRTEDRQFKEIFGDLDPATEVIDVVAGVPFSSSAFLGDDGGDDGNNDPAAVRVTVENCGDREGFSNVLITARLVSYNFIVGASVTAISSSSSSSSSSPSNKKKTERFHSVSFTAPVPGTYVLEVKTVHANGTSDNPRVPRSLGVVGIRAVVLGRKAFIYNTQCDYQRHVVGSPMLVRAHDPKSEMGKELLTTRSEKTSNNNKNNQIDEGGDGSIAQVPLCKRGDFRSGYWVRMSNPKLCHMSSNPYCAGDPEWVTDASAYNTQYVWVPTATAGLKKKGAGGKKTTKTKTTSTSSSMVGHHHPACKYQYFTPPQGPARSCLRFGESRAFLYLVGDSVIREYAKSCDLVSLRSAKLQCLFANIALEGQHFSDSYAASVAKTIVTNIRENNAGVFATNLGLQHMIGPCTTRQWRIFVRYFVMYWKMQIVWAKGAKEEATAGRGEDDDGEDHDGDGVGVGEEEEQEQQFLKSSVTLPPADTVAGNFDPQGEEERKLEKFYYNPKFIRTKGEYPKLEQAIWVGPPTIQYARKGMGAERAQLWDDIAWRELRSLGFRRLRTAPITAPRQESTWDGLHYASERNKVQTSRKNKEARVYHWNGGVANVLITILLNMVCNR